MRQDLSEGARVDHGIADWPDATVTGVALPECLPNGRPWPSVRVLILPADGHGEAAATVRSLHAQDYPRLRHDIVANTCSAADLLREALTDPAAEYCLWLRAGDMLAPGALAAMCLEAALSGAGAVAGLRVLYDRDVQGLDVVDEAGTSQSGDAAEYGDVLVASAALVRVIEPSASALPGSADLWSRLRAAGIPRARIGRPVLLRQERRAVPEHRCDALSIVSLTDLGYGGGAGIAHRRLTEALSLSGHRVLHHRLSDESPAAAAEWTDRFPRLESEIREGGHHLVLAGNLHGATRGGGLLGRLAASVPTAVVLHDLFALTGRCAHPKGCTVIATGCDARCPTPTEYPQLAPPRIADAYRAKRDALRGPRAPLLLANSAWTEERARTLAPEDASIARLRLAFPTGVFRPRDRAALRRELGLPGDDVLVLFAAVIADAPDKGFDDLVATMKRVARPGIGFVAVGRLDHAGVFGLPGLIAPGPIGDEETLARWYAACDLYLTASRLETLGQTPIEAGLCGTPTVAYRATGLTSAVIDGVTGLLVEPVEGALAQALGVLIADPARRQRLGAYARIVLENRFSHAAAAISLHDALSGWQAPPGVAAEHGGRQHFTPGMLARFAFAADRHPGEGGLVAPPSRPLVRRLRRAKQAVFGRGMPLWMRRALYAAALLRRASSRNAVR